MNIHVIDLVDLIDLVLLICRFGAPFDARVSPIVNSVGCNTRQRGTASNSTIVTGCPLPTKKKQGKLNEKRRLFRKLGTLQLYMLDKGFGCAVPCAV